MCLALRYFYQNFTKFGRNFAFCSYCTSVEESLNKKMKEEVLGQNQVSHESNYLKISKNCYNLVINNKLLLKNEGY